MIPTFKNVHNKFKLNGHHYSRADLKHVAYSFIKEGEPFEIQFGHFLTHWLDNHDFIINKTSGTTQDSKNIKIKKQHMVHSALTTGDFFNLEPGDSALHCLPTDFIAGKMMLVRALILGLELHLVKPTSNPLQGLDRSYHFCAMTPYQVQQSLNKVDQIKTLIIGGAPVSGELRYQLTDKLVNAYETYGMTETVTHVAARKLNNMIASEKDTAAYFKALPNVSFKQDERNCLIIDAPKVSDQTIVTNDMVKFHNRETFEWLGRFDNMINSGGVKIFPEQIEKKLEKHIASRFFIASEKDKNLGEHLILVVETDQSFNDKKVFGDLSKYEIPKKSYSISKFIETTSGKIQRKKTLELLN